MTLVDAHTGEVVSGRIAVSSVVFDVAIYPRAEWSAKTIERYAESLRAGEVLPPIILEAGTDRLLDGLHRWKANQQVGTVDLEVERHVVPDGMPAKLYAASLSARHGDRMPSSDLKTVAREVVAHNPEFSHSQVARMLGVGRDTVGRWVGDITDHRRSVTNLRAVLLVRSGMTQSQAAKYLEVSQPTVSRAIQDVGSDNLNTDLLADALVDLPDECAAVADQIRDEMIFGRWSEDEQTLRKRLLAGETVVVNLHRHADFIGWAEGAGLYVRVDRKSKWGNPFALPDDGDRETVIANYRDHYLPHKPSLLANIAELQGKALGCWCAPEACHADVLAEEAAR